MSAPAGFAVTIDDLPVISVARSEPPFEREVTNGLLEALDRTGVSALGFVVGKSTRRAGKPDPERIELAHRWLDAGHELGNHTFSHFDLHGVSRAAYEADVLHGDAVVRELLAAWRDGKHEHTPRWFRHPYLNTGRDLATRDAVTDLLARRGVRVAPATVIPEDFYYSAAWEWTEDRGDTRAMERIENAYLAHISECSEMARELSLGIFGREIPQIVDLHANALNAKVLAQVVERHAEVFGGPISLDTAMADPAYDTPNVFSEDRGASWLERWALERGVEVPSRVGAPDWVRDASRTPLVIQARRSAARAVRALRSGGGALLRGRSRAPYAT